VSEGLRNSSRHEENRDSRDEKIVAQEVEGPQMEFFIGRHINQGASDEQGPDADLAQQRDRAKRDQRGQCGPKPKTRLPPPNGPRVSQ